MGLSDWFSRRKPEPQPAAGPPAAAQPAFPLPQLCYDVAYFILPHYAYNELGKLEDLCRNTPTAAGPFFYTMACLRRNVRPVEADAIRFRWHHGDLGGGREHFTLEYPAPPPHDLAGDPAALTVLAPHFSAVVRDGSSGGVQYFVLGQAPFNAGTTFRTVTRDGANCNLGRGPEPRLEAFHQVICDYLAR